MSIKHIALTTIFLFALLRLGAAHAAEQAPAKPANPPLLVGAQVTESALIDALAIDSPEVSGDAKTRGFRPIKPGETPAAKPNAGKANLLVTFETNSATLTSESKRILNMLARALQSDRLAGFSFKIEGHADARGEANSNLKLSQLRAESVASFLVTEQGLLPERLHAMGKGSSEPINKSRVDAPENRRVTIVTVKESAAP